MIPFHPLLARDLADQTLIARSLAPASSHDSKSGDDDPSRESDQHRDEAKPASKAPSALTGHPSLGTESEDLAPLTEIQERTLRRTQLLKLKAEAELARPETPHPPDAVQKKDDSSSTKDNSEEVRAAESKPVDPKLIKAGYQKAIELVPRAVEQMERAAKSLKQKDPRTAYPPAEEARKILEQIQQAQPRQEQQDQKQQDQDKKKEDQQKKDQKDQQKNDQQKKDQQKDDREKKDQPKDDEEKKKPEQSKKSEDQKQSEPQVSRDRIEEALRKVRERQQEKRERDRRMKARVFGRVPVEKDW